tara:strand:- start:2314 stop:5754 length:3441 start_codon:yes stop_codon:yes gene_type:complete
MISKKSFTERLLPNVFVKSVTLDSELKPGGYNNANKKFSAYGIAPTDSNLQFTGMVPDDTMMSTVVLSSKFIESSTFKDDITQLLESNSSTSFVTYVHQITSREVYEDFLETLYTPTLLYQSEGLLTDFAAKVLGTVYENSLDDGIVTQMRQFGEVYDTINQGETVGSGTQILPKQILSDGTVINELITEFVFEGIPKNVDFLAYISFTAIQITMHLSDYIDSGADYDDSMMDTLSEVYGGFALISSVSKEIVLLDKNLQNQAIQFRIAEFPSNANVSALSQFGNPGEVWAGGVHIHNGRFMAGGYHSNQPHPFLDYSIVKNSRFVDNRIKQKVQQNITNITKTLEHLYSFISPYKSSAINKNLTKQKTKFISDLYLSQSPTGEVYGSFVVDKSSVILNKSPFSFLLDNAKSLDEYFPGANLYDQVAAFFLPENALLRCQVYKDDELLGTLAGSQQQTTSQSSAKDTSLGNSNTISFTLVNERNIILPKKIDNGFAVEKNDYDKFSFRHVMADPLLTTNKYSVVVEYYDFGSSYVKAALEVLNLMKGYLSYVLKYAKTTPTDNSFVGFDNTTGNIKQQTIQNLIDNGLAVEKEDGAIYPTGFDSLPFDILLIILYNPKNFSRRDFGGNFIAEFRSYLLNLADLSTTNIQKLLILDNFLNLMISNLTNILDTFGVKPTTVSNPSDYSEAVTTSVSTSQQKIISLKSDVQEIKIHDHGYDFTGLIDSNSAAADYKGRRSTGGNIGLVEITVADYELAVQQLARQVLSIQPDQSFTNSIGGTFECINITKQQTISDSLYSYLCGPGLDIEAFKSFVHLPGINKDSEYFTHQTILTAISKFKSEIFESQGGYYATIPADLSEMLTADLVAILNKDGTNLFDLTTDPESASSESPSIVQEGFQITTVSEDFSEELLNPSDNSSNFLGDVKGNKFKVGPEFTLQTVASNINKNKINLLTALFSRKSMTKLGPGESLKSFVLPMSKNNFDPFDDTTNFQDPPLQVLCLSLKDPAGTVFKNYMSNGQGYIANSRINPARLSQFWFIHQNIVRVEYLSGFESYQVEIPVKSTSSSPYSVPEEGIYSEQITNLKRPKWRVLNNQVITTLKSAGGSGDPRSLICRLVPYVSNYINKNLVNEFKMPLMHSYFKLTFEK